ncbi:hypothetical protein [Pedobacter frigidisoli]|uniref:hypothetical protein n=1 Tax=Pedobacter frigidisoli TaxID=2530455 RepID=UPI0029308A0E|nr:hypothetical protein [Pedobacter frigidisoli]
MKTTKAKSQKKVTKKDVKKQLEQSLTAQFLDVVKGLGHDASEISTEVAKASKRVAKKLTKKFTIIKSDVGHKIDDLLHSSKEKVKTAKQDVKSTASKAEKTAEKVVKKAVSKTKPVIQSVKVAAIASEEKVVEAITKTASALKEKTVEPAAANVIKKGTGAAKKVASAASVTKKSADKAVENIQGNLENITEIKPKTAVKKVVKNVAKK